jgi:HEPN superfamily protein
MSADAGFRIRAKEVRAYLRSLHSLEKNIRPGRSFYRATAAITASRAAAFIMIYNSVEYAAREALVELRSDITLNGSAFDKIILHWRQEIIKAHFYDRLRQGTNFMHFLNELTQFMPGRLDWNATERDLPFSGNIDHEELFRFVGRIGYRWKPPKVSLGGTDLQLVRKMRNDLAHGLESFESIGAQFTTDDITEKFDRIREFMVSFLRMVDRYKTKRLYLQ